MRRDPELARRINLLFDVMHTRTEPPLNSAAAAAAMSARGGSAVSAAVVEQLRLGYRGDALDAQLSIVAEFFGVPSVYLTETRVRTGIDAQLHLVRLMREMGDRGPAAALSVMGGTKAGL
ncbi:XRE family transcriptional regulator [Mycobacterium sp. smrl_JER01]